MKRIYGVCLTVAMATVGMGVSGMMAKAAPVAAGYVQERGWDAPPPGLKEAGLRGHKDGIEAAHKDFDGRLRSDVHRHEEFRNPPVAERDKETYRSSFQHAYETAMAHYTHPRP